MAHSSVGPGAVHRLVDAAWSAGTAPADPDDPRVRAFAEFGLPPDSELATEGGLRSLHAWRDGLHTLPFFTAAVLQQATTREDVWAQLAQVRDQSAAFRRVRADLDRMLERSEVSADALRFQVALRDEALNLADLAGAAQRSAGVALGVVAQTGIVPLAQALKVGVDAAQGVGRSGSWTRIWRRLFHRHEYFLAQTNTQAVALTNALPQLEQLWQMPRIGGYLDHFAAATRQMGRVLRA